MLSSSLGDVRAMVKQKYLRGPQREVRAIAPGAILMDFEKFSIDYEKMFADWLIR